MLKIIVLLFDITLRTFTDFEITFIKIKLYLHYILCYFTTSI